MDDPTKRTRGGNGRIVRTLTTAERDAEAARLRARGYTYQQIAEELGWSNKGDAHHAVKRVLTETVKEAGDEIRAIELARLDHLHTSAMDVLEREHFTVSNGRVVSLDGSGPLPDDGPVLAAIDRLLKIQERRARLLGLDAPTKQNISISPDRLAAIEAMAEELGEQ
ncbi:hypothetical protein ACIGNW_00215 [Streptomyces sp. NPDC053707]|uniref:hypothetical protein n=1 Tax=Streptomyces sp. NPDC053707 TaxID=3365712 RepID=UPI0037D1BA9E